MPDKKKISLNSSYLIVLLLTQNLIHTNNNRL